MSLSLPGFPRQLFSGGAFLQAGLFFLGQLFGFLGQPFGGDAFLLQSGLFFLGQPFGGAFLLQGGLFFLLDLLDLLFGLFFSLL